MSVYVLGYDTSDDEWREVCRVEADSPASPVQRIVSVTDADAVEHIVRWNIDRYPEAASPRFIAADLGMRGTYGLADPETVS